MGGHLDSWDVGQGAHDDGGRLHGGLAGAHDPSTARPYRRGARSAWCSGRTRRTGSGGARAYRDSLDDDVSSHVAAIEMDGGSERPVGFGLGLRSGQKDASDAAYEEALATLRPIGELLASIEASEIRRGGGGADIAPLMEEGVPGLGLRTVGEHYFDWHHTEADTLDKVEPDNFRRATALLAVMGFVLADMEGTLKKVASK